MKNPKRGYLAEFDAAPAGEQYKLVQQWMKSEPLPFFKELREHRPILVTPECTLVTRFADVTDLLQMPLVFTADLYKPKMGVTATDVGYLMAHDDDALHTREKTLMQGLLNRDDLPRVRALVAEAAREILDDAGGSAEIVNSYCRAVPAHLVQDYFGLDGVARADLIRWSYWNQYDAFHNQPFHLNSEAQDRYIVEQHDKVGEQLGVYIAVLMARKLLVTKLEQVLGMVTTPLRWLAGLACMVLRCKPPAFKSKDDMVKRMVRSTFAKEVDFPLQRVGVNAGGLLIGAIETTEHAVAQVIDFFLSRRPDLLRELQRKAALDDPAEFDAMVWEALRFVPISPYLFRQTNADYTFAAGTEREIVIPAGNVLLVTQSAMFDAEANDRPDDFNARRNWYHHFNFGFGSHECLGKYIGMVMIPEMVRQLMLRKGLAEVSPISYRNGALYGPGPEAGEEGPFPDEYQLRWSAA